MTIKRSKLPMHNFLTFCYIALCIGFPLGLIVLTVGPSAWVASYAQENNISQSTESLLEKIVIVIYLIFTILLAIWLTKYTTKIQNKRIKYGIIGVLTIAFVVSLGIFSFKPQVMVSSTDGVKENKVVSSDKVEFVLGPYPDRARLEDIKVDGYTAVISLLHELVVPAEPILIKEEEENAKLVGVKLIRVPMLPWVSGNEEAIEKIKELATKGKGKYYVHCYLGRDRVNVFKTIIKSQAADALEADHSLEKARSLNDIAQFERGPVVKITDQIYLIPYPTEEEMFGYLLNGTYKVVISTMLPQNSRQTIEKEAQTLKNYGIKFVNIPTVTTNKVQVQTLIDSIKKMGKPLIVHDYKVDDRMATILKEHFK